MVGAWLLLLGRQHSKHGWDLLGSVRLLCVLRTMVMALGTLSTTDRVSKLKHRECNPMRTCLYATICIKCQSIPLLHDRCCAT